MVFLCFSFIQIQRFQSENEETLTTAQREVKQAIESAEANIDWMDKNYENISSWLLNQTKKGEV